MQLVVRSRSSDVQLTPLPSLLGDDSRVRNYDDAWYITNHQRGGCRYISEAKLIIWKGTRYCVFIQLYSHYIKMFVK